MSTMKGQVRGHYAKAQRVVDLTGDTCRVYCHICRQARLIDTVEAVRNDTWPECCGQAMDLEPVVRTRPRLKKKDG